MREVPLPQTMALCNALAYWGADAVMITPCSR
jgi:hypothetical protein